MHIFSRMRFLTLVSFLAVASLTTSCFDQPNFPVEPLIEFRDIFVAEQQELPGGFRRDSIIVRIGFQDGDGDLGLRPQERPNTDTINNPNAFFTPYQTTVPQPNGGFVRNAFTSNFFVEVFRLEGEVFTPVIFPDPLLSFTGAFQPLFEEGADAGPLEGTIDYRIFITPGTFQLNDVLKFRIQIADRALNLSNVIETDTLRVLAPIISQEP